VGPANIARAIAGHKPQQISKVIGTNAFTMTSSNDIPYLSGLFSNTGPGRKEWAAGSLQKLNFAPSCTMRGESALTTCPKVVLVKFPFTELAPSNWVWLKLLKVSSRNSRVLASVKRTVLSKHRSYQIPRPFRFRCLPNRRPTPPHLRGCSA